MLKSSHKNIDKKIVIALDHAIWEIGKLLEGLHQLRERAHELKIYMHDTISLLDDDGEDDAA